MTEKAQPNETRRIEQIVVTKRFRKLPTEAEIKLFAEQIRALGVLLHPIVITPKNVLIAGLRRLLAFKHLGWDQVPVRVVDLADIEAGQVAENVERMPFVLSEVVEIAEAMWDRLASPRGRPPKEKVANCHLSEKGKKTRDKVAKYCGISGRQVDKIFTIADAARKNPDEYGHYLEELDRCPRSVNRIERRIRASEELKKIKAKPTGEAGSLENQIIHGDCLDVLKTLPDGMFSAAIYDPPYGLGFDYDGWREPVKDDFEAYWKWLEVYHREIVRVVRPGGFIAVFQAHRYFRHFWDWFGEDIKIYAGCRERQAGFKLAALTEAWMPAVIFFKPGAPPLTPIERHRSLTFYDSKCEYDDLAMLHPCPLPLDTCEALVEGYTIENAWILDAFCGCGQNCIAAALHGRRYTGIERCREYVELARKRLVTFDDLQNK